MKDNEKYVEGRWFQLIPSPGYSFFTRLSHKSDMVYHRSQQAAEGYVGAYLADVKEAGASVDNDEILVGRVILSSKNVRVDMWNHVEMSDLVGHTQPARGDKEKTT